MGRESAWRTVTIPGVVEQRESSVLQEAILPLFFFSIGRGTTLVEDEEGTICENEAEAHQHALEAIRALRQSGDFGASGWRMVVSDQNGLQVFELLFADVSRGAPP